MPIAAAAASPLLEWRGPVDILAGFAGIIALGLVLVQPLLIGGYLPGLSGYRGRRAWRIAHMTLAVVIVIGSVVHGMLVEGTMEMVSKATLCVLLLAAAIKVMVDLRVWRKRGALRGDSAAISK